MYRLICVSITGAFKTCSILALGVILLIPPIQMRKREGQQRYSQNSAHCRVKAGDFVGYMRILKTVENDPSILVNYCRLPSLVFDKNFNVLIPERDQWADPNLVARTCRSKHTNIFPRGKWQMIFESNNSPFYMLGNVWGEVREVWGCL